MEGKVESTTADKLRGERRGRGTMLSHSYVG